MPAIVILGTHDPDLETHAATQEAIIHAERELGVVLNTRWITPERLDDPAQVLDGTCGAVIAPRNPKHPRELHPELLAAIGWLRENRVPTLGIEAGYHHMLIEFARSILGMSDADSSGHDEASATPVVNLLEGGEPTSEPPRPEICEVEIGEGTQLAEIYGHAGVVREAFRGHYVMNPDYAHEYERAGIRLAARARLGERSFVAAIEWNALPYWIGVAYQPQLASSREHGHPLVRALVSAARDGA